MKFLMRKESKNEINCFVLNESHKNSKFNALILAPITITLIYNLNYNKLNYPFCRLKLLVEKFISIILISTMKI